MLQNGEAYVSHISVRATAGTPLRVQVVNRDGFGRDVEALALHDRKRELGAEDYGTFAFERLPGTTLRAHRPPDATGGNEMLTLESRPRPSRCGSATPPAATRPARSSTWTAGPGTRACG